MAYDMEALETLANLMGLDFELIKREVERREELSRLAWQQRENPNWQTTKAHYRYEEIAAYGGRQVFFNDWFGLYLVTGLEGGMRETTNQVEALVLLYQGRSDDEPK